MNKLDFLRRLDKALQVLEKEERKEILAFYEERFYNGTIYENKTEEQVIAELESPDEIARNVLEEYGVSPKYVKTKEERYSNINTTNVVLIILFDVFVVTWLIPSLYSIVISIFGSLFTYISVIPLMLGTRTFYDEFTFAFLTAGYVLLFIFGLVVLDAAIYVTKKVIIWHFNVFKFKNRAKYNKKLSSISVEAWFKRHRMLKTLKNIALVGALVTLVYTGQWLFRNQDDVVAYYNNTEVTLDEYTVDVSSDILLDESWGIETDFDLMDVDIVLTTGETITVYHQYTEKENFVIDIDEANNMISIEENMSNYNFIWQVEDLFNLIGMKKQIRIEIPSDLLLNDLDIETTSGSVDIDNVDMETLDVYVTNGDINLQLINLQGDLNIDNTNGDITVIDVVSGLSNSLNIDNTNGRITVERVLFGNY